MNKPNSKKALLLISKALHIQSNMGKRERWFNLRPYRFHTHMIKAQIPQSGTSSVRSLSGDNEGFAFDLKVDPVCGLQNFEHGAQWYVA